jgi:hypothetical protein
VVENDFKMTKRIAGTPDTFEDYVENDTANKRLTVLSGGELVVQNGATLNLGGQTNVSGSLGIGGDVLLGAGSTFETEGGFTLTKRVDVSTTEDYVENDVDNKRLTVLSGGELSVAGTLTSTGAATIAASPTAVFGNALQTGQKTVTAAGHTQGVGTTWDFQVYGGYKYTRSFHRVNFPSTAPSVPRVFLTVATTANATDALTITNVLASDVGQLGFDLVVDNQGDFEASVTVNWLAIC